MRGAVEWVALVLALLFVIGGLADLAGIYDLGLGPR